LPPREPREPPEQPVREPQLRVQVRV